MNVENIMQRCVEIARANETPFGAALINASDEILAIAPNTGKNDGPLAHAEMNVLHAASRFPNEKLALVTTCEPCPMCAGAAIWAKVEVIYYGVSIEDAGKYLNQIDLSCKTVTGASWREIEVIPGILQAECEQLMIQHS